MADRADRRRSLLTAALGFAHLEPRSWELRLLHRWLDSWRGIGDVVNGMHRAGWDLQLTGYGGGYWRATFYVTGMAHSIVGGSGWGGDAVERGAASGVGRRSPDQPDWTTALRRHRDPSAPRMGVPTGQQPPYCNAEVADEVFLFLESRDRPFCFPCLRQAFPQASVMDIRQRMELARRYGAPLLIGDGRCSVCDRVTIVVAYIPGDPELSRL